MVKAKIKKNFIFLLIASCLTNVCLFIINIILIKNLSKTDFGIFMLINSIIYIYLMFSELGISQGTIKYISEYIGKGYKELAIKHINIFFTVTLLITLLCLIIFYLSLPIWTRFYPYIPNYCISLFALTIIPYPIIRYWNAVTDGFQEMKYSLFFSLAREPIKLFLLFFAVSTFGITLKTSVVIFLISSYFTLFCSYGIYRSFILKSGVDFKIEFDKRILFDKEKLKYFLYLYIAFLIFWIQPNLLYLIVGHYSTPQSVAAFSSCFMLNNILWVVFLPLMDTLFPFISSIPAYSAEFKKLKNRVFKLQTLCLFVAVFWIFLIYFFGDKIILLLYGKDYLIYKDLLFLLSQIFYFENFRVILDPILKGTNYARVLLFIEFIRIIFIYISSPFLLLNENLVNLSIFLIFLSCFINLLKAYFIKKLASINLIIYYLCSSLGFIFIKFILK